MSAHGTEHRYGKGCRCDECRNAATAARRLRRQGKGPGKTPLGLQVHGLHGYSFHRCRCEVCRAAHAKMQREWYARHRARGVAA